MTQPSNAMHPPKGKILIGSGDFIKQGEHQLDLLIKYIGLESHQHILDIGCGQGRTAVALTQYLTAAGRYDGIDIMPDAIDWCQKRIQSRYPQFKFYLIESDNQLYQTSDVINKDIRLTFSDHHFDKCFLFSVFTHLTQSFVSEYLFEISRVLKQGEQCLCTMFIYDQEHEAYITSDNDGMTFPHDQGGYQLMSDQIEEANVAYSKSLLLEMVDRAGMKMSHYVDGYWKDWVNKSDDNSFQDIVVLQKAP